MSKDDNDDVEKNRKTSSGRFWFLKPGNILSGGGSGNLYNPYHTIAATPSNTFKTSPSTARLDLHDDTLTTKMARTKKRKKFSTPFHGEKPIPFPLPVQVERKSRIRTTSLCDPKHEISQMVEPTGPKRVRDPKDVNESETIDPLKSPSKLLQKHPEMPSNFETSEAVFRLQELFSNAHGTHSTTSSIASGEVPAGVAYAESCMEAMGASNNPLNTNQGSRNQSPLTMSNRDRSKPPFHNSSHSTLIQSNSTSQLEALKDHTQTKKCPSPTETTRPFNTNAIFQKQLKRNVINTSVSRKQSSPSPQRQEYLRLTNLVDAQLPKSKSTSNFVQYQKLSPIKDRYLISNEDVEDAIPENDNMDKKYFKDEEEREHNDHSRTIIEKVETMDIAQVREESFKIIAIKNRHSKDDNSRSNMNREKSCAIQDDSFLILDPTMSNVFEQVKRVYADWLYNSRLFIKHCEVLNKFKPFDEIDKDNTQDVVDPMASDGHIENINRNSYTDNLQVECSFLGGVKTSCGFCGECDNLEPQCSGCRKTSLFCNICRMPVFGLASCCLKCNHGGHTLHIQEWFRDRYLSS